MNKIKYIILLSVIVVFTGCVGDVIIDLNVTSTKYHATELFSFNLTIDDENTISIVNVNGDIIIEASSTASNVLIEGERIVGSYSQRDADQHLGLLDVDVNSVGSLIYVESDYPEHSDGRLYQINYHIIVPEDFKINVTHVNGLIQITAVRNDITVYHVNGEIDLNNTYGNIDLNLVNGIVNCIHELPNDASAEIGTINSIVNFNIPASTSSDVIVSTTNGNISTNNLSFSNQSITAHSFFGTLGSGDANVNISTVNGSVYLNGI